MSRTLIPGPGSNEIEKQQNEQHKLQEATYGRRLAVLAEQTASRDNASAAALVGLSVCTQGGTRYHTQDHGDCDPSAFQSKKNNEEPEDRYGHDDHGDCDPSAFRPQ